MDARVIEELARKLAETVPPGVRALQVDMERNFRAALEAGLGRMNLVTREEFDVQRRVLERSREKLTALEAQLVALEQRLDSAGR
jgi:BMFP domain-containing protein YqiC